MIYSFYIFDRHCNCIYDRQYWGQGSINKNNDSDRSKLLFGTLYSLKTICGKLVEDNQLKSFSIGDFRLHFYESASTYKFVLVSDAHVDNLQSVLYTLYSKYFVETVALNALSPVEFGTGYIRNSDFVTGCDEYLKSIA